MEKLTADEITKQPALRKRLGRPPKVNAQDSEPIDEMEFTAEERTSPTSPTNCRRSTRKKIVKFDVLDVLNKSRKTHKIQIEARIDSNAPTTSTQMSSSVSPAPSPVIDVNRLIAPRPPVPVVSPLLPLDMFAKPKPTPSLIVAQVSSDKTSSATQQQQSPQSPSLLRKRGRPRKAQLLENVSDVGSLLSLDSGSSISTDTNLRLASTDSESFSIIEEDATSDVLMAHDSNAFDANIEMIETEIITVASDEDSNSQIIFVDIDTSKLESDVGAETEVEAETVVEQAMEEAEDEPTSSNFKIIFPNDDQLETQEIIVEQHNAEESEGEVLVEVLNGPSDLWFTEDDKDDVEEQVVDELEQQPEPESHSNIEVATHIEVVSEQPSQNSIEDVHEIEMLEQDNAAEPMPDADANPDAQQKQEEELQENTLPEEVKVEQRNDVAMNEEPLLPTSSGIEENYAEGKTPQFKESFGEPSIPAFVATEETVETVIEETVETVETMEIVENTSSKGIAQFELEPIKRAAQATCIELKLPVTVEPESPNDEETKAERVEAVKVKMEQVKAATAGRSVDQSDLTQKASIKAEEVVPVAAEPLSKVKSSKSTAKPSPSPKVEKPSTSTASASVVECDVLFKDLEKTHIQLRNEEKARKRTKLANRKQPAEQDLVVPQPRTKKQTAKAAIRRNTVSEEHQDDAVLPLTTLIKRRNSAHPFKAIPSPEQSTEAERKPAGSGKKTQKRASIRKATAAKQLLSSQDSLDSSSSLSTRASEVPTRSLPTPTLEIETSNPLHDIEKFIEDGVKLLERDYKVEDEQQQQQQQQENPLEDELAQRVANLETPANTPAASPSGNTDDLSLGVRRSHRIKHKPQGAKTSLGRGSSNQTPTISMEQKLIELANVEVINEQFLRQEGLNTFQTLRDNYYRCARQVSKENAEMQCDCFVTGDEEGQQGQTRCGDGCINRMLMIECGPLCAYGDRCTNKRFQQHQGWPCRVFRTERKGCGITAELQIQPGEFIMEYVGEVIDSEEFERRQHLYSEDRNRHYYFMALRGEAIIDATTKGNISRYINHSCDPNAETQKWTVNGELRIGFFSVKTIMPGEEITFDYQYQRYGRDAQRCYCESANCRGWIGNEPESDEGEQLDTESESESESLAEELRPELEPKTKATRAIKSRKQLKLPIARKQRKEQPKAKERESKAGRWLRATSSEKLAARKSEQLEDPDVLEQLTLLGRSGLKNQLDTLRLSRCMVRAKLLQSRLQLLGVLTRGELPCRRLFLDYHGLRLLHAWISESGSDRQLRLALLESLESLPIPNRTMLNDSRVYQSVQLWINQLEQQAELPSPESSSLAEQPTEQENSLRQRIAALLQKWNGLPEIFRIPKRERIEQMKEHEREADRQQHVATALEDSNSASSMLNTDRYRQDRFRRDTISRYDKSKASTRMSGNNTICTITSQSKEWLGSAESNNGSKSDSRRRPEFDARRTISKELRRSLFERKVAQDEAEKRVGSEDWREHELRCEYFGADLNTDPKLLPFYQNTETKEWFNVDDVPVPAPLHCGDPSEPASPENEADVEYKLPAGVEPLPPSWHWSLTPSGDIYYYNLRDRISQWEPPNAEQRLQRLVEDSPEKEVPADGAVSSADLINIDIDYVGNLSAKSLAQYIEVKIKERRELRRSRLVSVRVISPRREEDRLYNQMESRKYKENKEKIRRRKEIYRRTRSEMNTATPAVTECTDSLPIHGYLFSSDEEMTTEGPTGEQQSPDSPAKDDKELAEAVVRRLPLRLSSPQSTSVVTGLEVLSSAKRKLPVSESQKKHRDNKRSKPLATGRDASDKFHFEISGHVADFLRPYRQDNCQLGRISSDEDYKFLIKRLSHHITTKEMRYCEMTGNPLACTESVKHKSYDFIKQYMRKKGPVYKRPVEKPD